MTAVASGLDQMTLDLTEEIRVHAPIDRAFASLLEELGPANLGYQDAPMPSTTTALIEYCRNNPVTLAMAMATCGGTCRPSRRRRCSRSPAR